MKSSKGAAAAPNSREGWAKHYSKRADRNPDNWQAQQMALWYLLLIEADKPD